MAAVVFLERLSLLQVGQLEHMSGLHLVHNHVSTFYLLAVSCFGLSAMMSVHFYRFLQSTWRHTLHVLQLGARHCGRQQGLHNVIRITLAAFLHIL